MEQLFTPNIWELVLQQCNATTLSRCVPAQFFFWPLPFSIFLVEALPSNCHVEMLSLSLHSCFLSYEIVQRLFPID
jgi:hypothetical protein